MEIESPKKYAYLDEYTIVKLLGAGYHAQVKLGVDSHGNQVAIKQYKKQTATLKTLQHELNIMKELNHDNLVRLINVRETATYKNLDESQEKCFAIVLEYVGGGQLFDIIADTGKFNEKISRTYFHQMMNGLHYMHSRGYAHRDIKPQNILLSKTFVLKLADFGFSCLVRGKDGSGVLHTKLGTEGYMAPEIPQKNYDGQKIDIFAAGVILFIMFAGNPPFEKSSPNDPYYKLIKDKNYAVFWKAHSRRREPNYFSKSFQDLFVKMIAFDPKERPTIQEIASHPWVKQPVCTVKEITKQFIERFEKLNLVLEERKKEQEIKKEDDMKSVRTQGQSGRGSKLNEAFLQIYYEEVSRKRKLPLIEEITKDDLIFNEDPKYLLSTLKEFLKTKQIKLESNDEEEQLLSEKQMTVSNPEIKEQNGNKLYVHYTYNYVVDIESIKGVLSFIIKLGQNAKGQVILSFMREEGDYLYYKKVTKEIANGIIFAKVK